MTKERKFEVHAEDKEGDLWIVATDRPDQAEHFSKKFKSEGYKNVKIIEIKIVDS